MPKARMLRTRLFGSSTVLLTKCATRAASPTITWRPFTQWYQVKRLSQTMQPSEQVWRVLHLFFFLKAHILLCFSCRHRSDAHRDIGSCSQGEQTIAAYPKGNQLNILCSAGQEMQCRKPGRSTHIPLQPLHPWVRVPRQVRLRDGTASLTVAWMMHAGLTGLLFWAHFSLMFCHAFL